MIKTLKAPDNYTDTKETWTNVLTILSFQNSDAQYSTYWPTEINQPITLNSVTIELTDQQEVRGAVERTFRLSRRFSQQRVFCFSHFLFLICVVYLPCLRFYSIATLPSRPQYYTYVVKRTSYCPPSPYWPLCLYQYHFYPIFGVLIVNWQSWIDERE